MFNFIRHAHIPDKNRQKLDDKSQQCVLLGLSQESKAYRMYDPISKRLIISRGVVFEEDKQCDWSKANAGDSCAILQWGDEDKMQEHEVEFKHEEEEEQVENDDVMINGTKKKYKNK